MTRGSCGSGCWCRVGCRSWSRCRRRGWRWSRKHRRAVKILPARDVIVREHLLVAHDRIHHRDDTLFALIRMAEPEPMAELVQKNAADIRDGGPVRDELQRAAIRVEILRDIKERIRFPHV